LEQRPQLHRRWRYGENRDGKEAHSSTHAGTFVAPPKIHFNKLIGFTEQMAARGLPASSKTLAAKLISSEPEIASRLNLPPSATLVKVARQREGGNEPFSLETCYCSADRFAGLIKAPLARSSLFAILERDYKLQMVHADEEIDAIAADAHMAEIFQVPKGSPLLRIRQVIFSSAGRPEIYVFGIYRADRHTIVVRRFR
jgi:GntR family transcriptional regulator